MVVLTSKGEVILKFLVTCNMHKTGVPRSIACALLDLLRGDKQSKWHIAYYIYNVALRNTTSVIPLGALTSSVTRWPYIQHTYTIDVVEMVFQHQELAGRHYEPMNFGAFLAHVEEEANTTTTLDTIAMGTEASGKEYVRYVGRRGQTHFCIRTDGWFELCKDKVIKLHHTDDCHSSREILEYTVAAIPSTSIIPLSEYKSKHSDACHTGNGDLIFHTISYFVPESPCWIKQVDTYLGIYTEFADDSPRMFRAQKPMSRIEYHKECDVANKRCKAVNKHIKVLSFKRIVDDDRHIAKGQLGIHLFSTTDGGNMFVFHSGPYCGEFMDLNQCIQFEYI